jgi:N6-adenosine-specific RNA methylase IME4
MKYRTIVADPPWAYGKFNSFSSTGATATRGRLTEATRDLPYDTMTLAEISALGVSEMAEGAAHLYLWTTQRYLWDAPAIVRAWGFKPSCVLTWCKPPMGSALGFAFAPTSEFVVFGHRGGLKPTERHESTWFAAARPFLDIVERVSPGPYLEMFARRARFGWDYYGNESLGTAEVAA